MDQSTEHREHHHHHDSNNHRALEKFILNIERCSDYVKNNWRTLLIAFWMVLMTYNQLMMRFEVQNKSTSHQIANLGMSIGDIRYSSLHTEEEVEKLHETISKLETSVSEMQTEIYQLQGQIIRNR